ncbi:probable 28S ribosomal protein S25, mitochondrial [Schistocerca americana]|uniref:probable 28S ribosomal protein S25, mitochondrial n=1 Tax=Schistocerca americana TaxID=7009 RepID=UPI001F4F7929|nr:probable 28S ribosomal protein S25, mitochondrial [Schistocerca americana]XP_047117529.1 probable 28S ribosomal protein S25, mitochondrial [Schistocerca piceifrons]XP_049787572.1 probable 28S ribosomal protein S25, mitochondrial [Schistocerca cancellata]XP_049815213.1 probable 28S ribosomal protein S25, mitochondrial [Schistocerca nitens]XP_049831369.1 probable 28S ribosomal protein S25, mitochondrial [Schistocerca gregaria]XP_049962955.1 probable 28S ribosomal protein S25, mitochondrial [S
MPFMKGRAPIRRTLKYLEAGKLIFKPRVKIFTVNYNTSGDHHQGARDFVFWYLPQIQYKNPDVQVATFKNMTPSPFIRCFFDDGEQMLIDIDSKTKEQVHNHVQKVICKPESVLAAELTAKEKKDNPANFGFGCEKHCICEILGQVPCPGVVPLPKEWRGKYKYKKE